MEALTNYLTDIAEKSKIKRFPGSNTHSKNNPPWFDKNCSNLKKEITALGKKIKRDPNNEEIKIRLSKQKTSLKKTVKKNKLAHKETILQKMKWSNKKAKLFWKLLGKLEHKKMTGLLSKESQATAGKHISKMYYKAHTL